MAYRFGIVELTFSARSNGTTRSVLRYRDVIGSQSSYLRIQFSQCGLRESFSKRSSNDASKTESFRSSSNHATSSSCLGLYPCFRSLTLRTPLLMGDASYLGFGDWD